MFIPFRRFSSRWSALCFYFLLIGKMDGDKAVYNWCHWMISSIALATWLNTYLITDFRVSSNTFEISFIFYGDQGNKKWFWFVNIRFVRTNSCPDVHSTYEVIYKLSPSILSYVCLHTSDTAIFGRHLVTSLLTFSSGEEFSINDHVWVMPVEWLSPSNKQTFDFFLRFSFSRLQPLRSNLCKIQPLLCLCRYFSFYGTEWLIKITSQKVIKMRVKTEKNMWNITFQRPWKINEKLDAPIENLLFIFIASPWALFIGMLKRSILQTIDEFISKIMLSRCSDLLRTLVHSWGQKSVKPLRSVGKISWWNVCAD